MITIKIYKNIEIRLLRRADNNKIVYVPRSLYFGSIVVLNKVQEIDLFIELLNSFVTNRLQVNKFYELANLRLQIKSKYGQKYLYIESENNKYYFEKYECSFITRVLNKILNKCTFEEFL